MKTAILIIGAGGHAKVLIDCLRRQSKAHILGILDNKPELHGQELAGVKILGGDDAIKDFSAEDVQLVNAIGSVDIPSLRKKIFAHYKSLGFTFFSVIHPNAIIALDVQLGEGVQIMAGAIIQPACKIGNNVIVNTGASLDHDVELADHIHIAPGVVISGYVRIGEASHIGVRAVILQSLTIGERCLVGAGAVVIGNIAAESRVVGVPAKKLVREVNTTTEEWVREKLE
jgi:sugar O-acyltransferase (sialic acid O-acetyltransferase NeuD family)